MLCRNIQLQQSRPLSHTNSEKNISAVTREKRGQKPVHDRGWKIFYSITWTNRDHHWARGHVPQQQSTAERDGGYTVGLDQHKQEFPLLKHDLCPDCLTSKDRIFEHTCATSECHLLQSGNCPEQRLDSMVKESKYRKAKGGKHELLSCRCKKRQGSPHQKGLLIL